MLHDSTNDMRTRTSIVLYSFETVMIDSDCLLLF
uniref:Uncharacterized protein n=1 Tax=Setaria italica TaxID=4555 RepID=K3YP43_SETIT